MLKKIINVFFIMILTVAINFCDTRYGNLNVDAAYLGNLNIKRVYKGNVLQRNFDFAGGHGTETNPYQIKNAVQLNRIRYYLGSHFVLLNDIDLSSYINWIPIGDGHGGGVNAFYGTFNGNNHVIKSLTINSNSGSNTDEIGFFGGIGLSGYTTEIKNLILENVNITATGTNWLPIGGLVGSAGSGIVNIENCAVISGNITNNNTSSFAPAGGIVGDMHNGTPVIVKNCYNSSAVTTKGLSGNGSAGGIVGRCAGSSNVVNNCYNTGKIIGSSQIGGIVGDNYATIMNSYNIGIVSGSSNVGGIAGINRSTLSNSISLTGSTSLVVGSGSATNCSLKNSIEMQTLSIYTGLGWDIDNLNSNTGKTWVLNSNISNKGYPYPQVRSNLHNGVIDDLVFSVKEEGYKVSIPKTGLYKIELWGANGSTDPSYSTHSRGGYTKGTINFLLNENVYIFIGKQGNNERTTKFNGGGYGGTGAKAGHSGGGATDVRLVDGAWNDFNSLKSRIMVAGAGGGTGTGVYNDGGQGSYGGGLIGFSGGYYPGHGDLSQYGVGGNQTSGGVAGNNIYSGTGINFPGSFGIGGKSESISSDYGSGGGGGGYYGGGSGGGVQSGGSGNGSGGGSSFISGHNGCNAISENSTSSSIIHTGSANHYSGKVFTNTVMIDGTGYSWTNVKGGQIQMPKPEGGFYDLGLGHTGNGYAKVDLIFKGLGTESVPYQIETAEQLNMIREYLNKYFILMKNIDMSNFGTWTPIVDFSGVLDGNGYEIQNITINNTGATGLFANISGSSRTAVKNLGITGSIVGNPMLLQQGVGGIAGHISVSNIKITSSWNRANIQKNGAIDSGMGGIVGNINGNGVKVENCYNVGNINDNTTAQWAHTGGIVGDIRGTSSVEKSYNIGEIKSLQNRENVGGVVGHIYQGGSLYNCYNIGKIINNGNFVAGIVARNAGGTSIVENCYNLGTIETTNVNKASIIASNDGTTNVKNCVALTGTCSILSVGTQTNCAFKSSTEMQTLSTYSSIGWNIDANLGTTGTIWVLNSSFGSLSYIYPQIRSNEHKS
jgi:hypothetical protein